MQYATVGKRLNRQEIKRTRMQDYQAENVDIILEGDFSCCKEIYYRAMEQDSKIGTATVYRMINTLEEIGVISRKNMYKVAVS